MSGNQSALIGASGGIKPNGLINGASTLLAVAGTSYPLDQVQAFAKKVQSGAVTAGVLKTVLSLSGKGVLSFLGCASTNATRRTHRLKVTLDGVVIFDATTLDVTNETSSVFCVIGTIVPLSPSYSFAMPEVITFDKSLLVEYAGSLSETDGAFISYRYMPRA